MRRLFASAALVTLGACIDFDQRLVDCDAGRGLCSPDGGATGGGSGGATGGGSGGATGGGSGGATGGGSGASLFFRRPGTEVCTSPDFGTLSLSDGGPGSCPGFTHNGWCWMNPTPQGDDLLAVACLSDSDIWAAGRAGALMHWDGLRWADHRASAPAVLDATPTVGEFQDLAVLDGGLLAVGYDLRPIIRVGGVWTDATSRYPAGAQTIRESLSAIAVDESGLHRVVSYRSAYYQGLQPPALLTSVTPTSAFTAVQALGSQNGFVMGATLLDGGHAVFLPDGGVVPVHIGPEGNLYWSIGALWTTPTSELWYGGNVCSIGQVFLSGATPTHATPCPNDYPLITTARWSIGADRHVLTGSNGELLEATSAELAGGVGTLTNAYKTGVPLMSSPTLNDVCVPAPGCQGGLAVGQAGVLATRVGLADWAYRGTPLRTNLYGAAPFGSGVFVTGGDTIIAYLAADGGAPVFVTGPGSGNEQIAAVWASPTKLFAVGGQGSLWESTTPAPGFGPLNLLVSPARELTAIAGLTEDSLWATGPGGYALQHVAGGSWRERMPQPLPDGGLPDFRGSVALGADVLIAGWVSSTSGYLYRANSDGGITRGAALNFGPEALALSPGGTLWIAGDDAIASMPLDGGPPVRAAWPSNTRMAYLTGVVALSDTDVWAAGGDVVLHFNGSTWVYDEPGTRTWFNGLTASRDPSDAGTLWLFGNHGAVLRKKLP